MSLALYRLFYFVFWTLSFPLSLLSNKLKLGLKGRAGLLSRIKVAQTQWAQRNLAAKPYWFHFASAGELEQALPIAEKIKQQEPQSSILFTYFSPSGAKGIGLEKARRENAGKLPPWDHADYLPLDLPWSVLNFLKLVRPKALILINREIWPELIIQSHQKQIPIFLFSAFFPSAKSRMLKFWLPYLKYVKCIGTVGESSTQILLQLEPSLPVHSLGDTRIERVLERQKLQSAPPAWGSFIPNKQLLVAASLWKEDFEALKPSIEAMTQKFPQWRWCLVPHEPDESFILEIRNWGKSKNILFRRFSHFLETPDEVSPLIMDKVGYLAELYRFSSIAFVGGSFRKKVHNILEPAAYQNSILTGPKIQNSFEAQEMALSNQGLTQVDSAEKLQLELVKRASNAALISIEGKAAYQYLIQRLGASQAYYQMIASHHDSSKTKIPALTSKPILTQN